MRITLPQIFNTSFFLPVFLVLTGIFAHNDTALSDELRRASVPGNNQLKLIRQAFEAADDGFDMVKTQNHYSGWVAEAIFEPLLSYDYMARPLKLIPLTAKAMPQISEEGRVLEFTLKPGILFSPDPAFKGQPRELVAQDYVYSLMRIMDPRNRSPHQSFIAGKIKGLDALAEQARKSGHFNYDAKVSGLQVQGKYQLRIELNDADHNFQYVLAYAAFGAVAREVIEKYDEQTGLHPVGTGPYQLSQYLPRSKIILSRNPNYRGFVWNFAVENNPRDLAIQKQMQGKTMPQIERVEISIIEEEQSRWLAFLDQQLDLDKLPQSAAPTVLEADQLKAEYQKQGIGMYRVADAGNTFTFFNMRDPVVGGLSKEKIALRRAIAMVYNQADDIAQMRMGQAIKAEMMIPPDVGGYDSNYRSSISYDIALANKLLDRFGYKRGDDGYRRLPDGNPLVLYKTVEPAAIYKIQSEIFKRGLDKLGIRIEFPVANFADNMKAATACQLMMWSTAWNADIPDGENFLQLLYGPKAGQGNYACYQSPRYDQLFQQAQSLPPGPERYALYQQMNRIMEADTPWIMHVVRMRSWLYRPWVMGFKKHPILHADWQFLDLKANDKTSLH